MKSTSTRSSASGTHNAPTRQRPRQYIPSETGETRAPPQEAHAQREVALLLRLDARAEVGAERLGPRRERRVVLVSAARPSASPSFPHNGGTHRPKPVVHTPTASSAVNTPGSRPNARRTCAPDGVASPRHAGTGGTRRLGLARHARRLGLGRWTRRRDEAILMTSRVLLSPIFSKERLLLSCYRVRNTEANLC
jgi:hypothetical protein